MVKITDKISETFNEPRLKDWKEYPSCKPTTDCYCYVNNNKRGYQTWLAFYNKSNDYFNMNGQIYEGLPIHVTHFVQLPLPPEGNY